MNSQSPDRPVLRIVRGTPTPEEVAVVTAVVSAVAAAETAETAEAATLPRGRWNDPAWWHRPPLLAGVGGWRASGR